MQRSSCGTKGTGAPTDTGREPTIQFQYAGPGGAKSGQGRDGGGMGEVQCCAATVSHGLNIFCSPELVWCLEGAWQVPQWCRNGTALESQVRG